MSKLFLEINEIAEMDKSPKSFKIEVKDIAEAKKKLKEVEPTFVGLNYIKRIHFCRHIDIGEITNQSCSIIEL